VEINSVLSRTIKASIFILTVILFTAGWCLARGEPSERLWLGKPEEPDGRHPATFVETEYIDDTPLPSPGSAQEKNGYILFQRHWMDLIFPNSIPQEQEVTDRLQLVASRGEYEPVSFCIHTLKELEQLTVRATRLTSPGGDYLAAPKLSIVRCVPRLWQPRRQLYENGPYGVLNMPAYLEELRSLDVAEGRTVQFWVTVKIEDDAKPGVYQGEIWLHNAPGRGGKIRIEVKVLDIDLLDPPQSLGFYDFQRPYHGEIGPLKNVYRMLREHGVTTIFTAPSTGIHTYDKKTDTYDFSRHVAIDQSGKATVTLNGSVLAEFMEAAKEAGIETMVYTPTLPEFLRPYVRSRYDKAELMQQSEIEVARILKRFEHEPSYETIKQEITAYSKKYPSVYSQPYGDIYSQVIKGIIVEVKLHDWPTLIVSSWDEARHHHRAHKIALPSVLRHIELEERAGAITLFNDCSPFLDDEYGAYTRAIMKYVDIAMPNPQLSLDPQECGAYNATLNQIVAAFATEGIATYTYRYSACDGGVFATPGLVRYSSGFFYHTLGKGVQNNFDYIFFRPEYDPYNPTDHPLWAHERLWFFPPQEELDHLGGRSISLAAKREGFDDLRYIHTLETLISQAEAAERSPDARQVARKARAALKGILESFTFSDDALDHRKNFMKSRWDNVNTTPGSKPTVSGKLHLHIGWDYETYDQNRRAIAGQIIKLQKALN
jgi:hypothetical protein